MGTTHEVWAHVRNVQNLLTGGMSGREAVRAYYEQLRRAEADGGPVAPTMRTVYRYLDMAFKDMAIGDVGSPSLKGFLAKAVRKRVMRQALTKTRSVFVNGEERRVPDPDLRTVLDAQRDIDKLDGVDPDSRAAQEAMTRRFFDAVTDMMREFLPDEETRERARRWLVHRLEGGVRAAGFGDLIDEARSVVVEQLPATSGKNGSTNGHHPPEEHHEEQREREEE